jgi:non-ribosomal peptide synthetase component F
VLLHEFLDIHESLRNGRETALHSVRPFRDYVAWLGDRDDGHAERYWRQSLSGITTAPPLGLDALSTKRRGATGEAIDERQINLSADATASLQALARSERLTLSTLIYGAWAQLLARYTGQSDVLFGVTVSGRPPELSGVESMIGLFINTLPLRVAVLEDSHLVPWLRKLQSITVELRQFEAIPFSWIQAWSDVPAGMPLFESIVIVQNLPFVASLQERGSRLGIESARYLERTHYPLALTFLPGPELQIKVGFDSERFDPWTIERTLSQLSTLLTAMAADPERRLADLPVLSEGEREQLLCEWNQSQRELAMDERDVDELTEAELDTLIEQLR